MTILAPPQNCLAVAYKFSPASWDEMKIEATQQHITYYRFTCYPTFTSIAQLEYVKVFCMENYSTYNHICRYTCIHIYNNTCHNI